LNISFLFFHPEAFFEKNIIFHFSSTIAVGK
jgi:hypothetical protein